MKLSKKCEYAILAMIHLAKRFKKELVTIQKLSDENEIPRKFLEQILIILKRQRLVKSIRGPKGGYEIAKSPTEISVAEIVRLIDGPLAPVNSVSVHYFEHTPIEKNQQLKTVMKEIRDYMSSKLEECKLDQLY